MSSVECYRIDCFGNTKRNHCKVLHESPEFLETCPFHKTKNEVLMGDTNAKIRLIEQGRQDLIEKYNIKI